MKKTIKKSLKFITKWVIVSMIGIQATTFAPAKADAPISQNSGSQPRIIQSLVGYSPTDYQLDEEVYNKYVLYNEVISAGLSYSDYKKLSKIAYCESTYRQYNDEGEVLKGPDGHDGGIFQIRSIHEPTAKKLGTDLGTLQGNIEYAIYLYKKNGTQDWYSSSPCHKLTSKKTSV